MKRITSLISIPLFLFFLSGCKETPPTIDFGTLKDTTYLAGTIPAPQNTKIYIEDLTGVKCNNCPKAAIKIKDIITANPGNVVALAVYPTALTNLMSPWVGFEVLNTKEADDIFTGVFNNPSFIPTGGVNRKLFSGESAINVSYNNWTGYADIIKTIESPVVINSKVLSFDSITRKIRINIKAIFAKKFDEPVNLSLYLSESKIISKQLMPDQSTKDDYEHNHALRKAITPYNGIPLKINDKTIGNYEAGRTFEIEYEIDLDPKWKKENCAIVVLVNRFDTDSKEVLQAAELDLK